MEAAAAITALTNRSKSPARNGSVTASAIIRITACEVRMLRALAMVGNVPGSASEKATIRTTTTSRPWLDAMLRQRDAPFGGGLGSTTRGDIVGRIHGEKSPLTLLKGARLLRGGLGGVVDGGDDRGQRDILALQPVGDRAVAQDGDFVAQGDQFVMVGRADADRDATVGKLAHCFDTSSA